MTAVRIWLLCSLALFPVFAQEWPDPPAPVLWYGFKGLYEGEVEDEFGKRNGTLEGTVTLVNGKRGNSLVLDSNGEWVDTPLVDVEDDSWSASAWFRLTGSVAAGTNRLLLLQQAGTGASTLWLAVKNDGGTLRLQSKIGGTETLGGTVTTGQWHHAAVVVDGNTLRLFLDGIQVASVSRTLSANEAAFRIGNTATGSESADKQWIGELDDVALYNRSLTPTDLQFLNRDFDTYTRIWVSPAGHDVSGDGSEANPYASFGKAVEVAIPLLEAGTFTRISLKEGLYREGEHTLKTWEHGGAIIETPLIVEGETLDSTIFSGADVWTDGWTESSPGVWSHPWTFDWGMGPDPWAAFPHGTLPNEMRRREMLILDGKRLDPVFEFGDLRDDTFFVDETADRIYYQGPSPNGREVQVPVRPNLIEVRAKSNLIVRRLHLQHFNSYIGEPSPIRIWGNGSLDTVLLNHNVIVEDCRFTSNSSSALSLSVINGGVVRRSRFLDTGFVGFGMSQTRFSRIEEVHSHKTNWRGYPQGYLSWSAAGAKITSTHDMMVRNFVTSENLTGGFWFDIKNERNLVTDLHAYHNKHYAVYYEFSPGPLHLDGAWLGKNLVGVQFAETNSGSLTNIVGVDNDSGLNLRALDDRGTILGALTMTNSEWSSSSIGQYNVRANSYMDPPEWDVFRSGMDFHGNRYANAGDKGFLFLGSGSGKTLAEWQAELDSFPVPDGKGDDDAQLSNLSTEGLTNYPLRWEVWTGLSQPTLTELTSLPAFQDSSPDLKEDGWLLEDTLGRQGAFGRRGTTRILAPVTGIYRFRLSADQQAQLWVSTSSEEADKVKVLEQLSPTFYRDPGVPVADLVLTGGQEYWLQVLHAGEGSASHVTVMWERPDVDGFRPLSAVHFTQIEELPVPLTIPSLVGWYDAQQLPGAMGAAVSQWPDITGEEINVFAQDLQQVTGLSGTTVAPTLQTVDLNGHTYRSVRFVPGASGEYELLKTDSLTSANNTSRDIVIVYRGGVDHKHSRVAGFGSHKESGNEGSTHWNLATNGSMQYDTTEVPVSDYFASRPLSRSEVIVRHSVMNRFNWYFEFWNDLEPNFSILQSLNGGQPWNVGSTFSPNFYLGDLHGQGAGGGAGAATFDVLEVFVFNDGLSSEERSALYDYLETKYTSDPGPPPVSPGILSFASSTVSVDESAGTLSVTVRRQNGSTGAVSVRVSTTDGTATSGSDYTSVSQILNWADGDSADKTVLVPILQDSAPEGDEAFSLNLTELTGASAGSPDSMTVTILDDEYETYLINFAGTGYITDGSNTWQTFDVSTADTGTGSPQHISPAVTLADLSGSTSRGLTFATSGGTNGTVSSPNTQIIAGMFTGDPPGWFDVNEALQRQVFTLQNGSDPWTFTFAGLNEGDRVFLDFVFTRDKTGDRAMTVSALTAGDILNDAQVDLDGGPQYPASPELTGSTSYTVTLVPSGTGWGCLPNAMRVRILPAPPPLSAPSGLSAETQTSTTILLTWTDTTTSETGFRVQRSLTSGSGFSTVHTAAADTVAYTDTVAAGTVYFYQILATDGDDESNPSNEASASTKDSDSDGMLDDHETLAGSDPGLASSIFKASAVDPGAGDFAFEFPSALGSYYRVFYSDSLEPVDWQVLSGYGNLEGTGNSLPVNDSPAGTRFYKVEVKASAWQN